VPSKSRNIAKGQRRTGHWLINKDATLVEEAANARGDVMLEKDIKVEAFWDEEAKVWVASSDDVPGLITEAPTMELLIQKIRTLIPELFRANNIIAYEGMIDIPVHLLGRWQEVIKVEARNG
jgi:hypothetical protein